MTGSITLLGRDDRLSEGNESLVVEILGVDGPATENGTQQVTLTLLDDASDPFVLNGSQLTILATPGNDVLTFQLISGAAFSVDLNGTSMNFTLALATTITFDSQAGNDTLLFYGNANPDAAVLSTSSLTVSGTGYTFSATNLEYKYLFGDANDSATFNDMPARISRINCPPTH